MHSDMCLQGSSCQCVPKKIVQSNLANQVQVTHVWSSHPQTAFKYISILPNRSRWCIVLLPNVLTTTQFQAIGCLYAPVLESALISNSWCSPAISEHQPTGQFWCPWSTFARWWALISLGSVTARLLQPPWVTVASSLMPQQAVHPVFLPGPAGCSDTCSHRCNTPWWNSKYWLCQGGFWLLQWSLVGRLLVAHVTHLAQMLSLWNIWSTLAILTCKNQRFSAAWPHLDDNPVKEGQLNA